MILYKKTLRTPLKTVTTNKRISEVAGYKANNNQFPYTSNEHLKTEINKIIPFTLALKPVNTWV